MNYSSPQEAIRLQNVGDNSVRLVLGGMGRKEIVKTPLEEVSHMFRSCSEVGLSCRYASPAEAQTI